MMAAEMVRFLEDLVCVIIVDAQMGMLLEN